MKDKGDGRRWRQKETSHHDADLTPEKGGVKRRSGADEHQHYPETISARLTGGPEPKSPIFGIRHETGMACVAWHQYPTVVSHW